MVHLAPALVRQGSAVLGPGPDMQIEVTAQSKGVQSQAHTGF